MKAITNQEKVEDALIKKALGYDSEEITKEYSYDEKSKKSILTKTKKTVKHYPPDVSAIKILLSYYGDKTFDELSCLTDEELIIERDKLLEELKNLS